MGWHQRSAKEAENEFKTDFKKGLTAKEAERRLTLGENILEDGKNRQSALVRFLYQFKDFLIIVLLLAAGVSFGISLFSGEKDFVEPIIILSIVVLNALISFTQEDRAQKAVEELKKLSQSSATVIRNGEIKEILSSKIVCGDIILLKAGDLVPADGRLFSSFNLKTDESNLTGESESTEKDAKAMYGPDKGISLGDRHNMVFSGTYVTLGRGAAVVTATGMNTETGKIARLILSEEERLTPLQKRLENTGKSLGTIVILICALIFVIGIFRKMAPMDMFMTSVSLAVAAIPEGIPAIVTIVLAIGMQRLSAKNAIIRRLPAVETLGGTEVICSDKTGTLTENKMRLVKIALCGEGLASREEKKKVLKIAALCNDCRYNGDKLIGESTEKALVIAAEEMGENKSALESAFPRIGEISFSSERKMMTTIHKTKTGYMLAVKGAPEIIMGKCSKVNLDGKEMPFSLSLRRKTKDINSRMAGDALRVIAVAFKEIESLPLGEKEEDIEKELTFLGLCGLKDPLRPEAKEAVKLCKKAGIRPVMVTGDHVLTAIAIGKELNIYNDGDIYMTGAEMEALTDKELGLNIEKCSIFARVSPEHKVRIVKAYQDKGKVVAMTGDGINDAPALKAADIGCAMGLKGTDVAKGAADMILADDNFATIVSAVKEGRNIYSNIRKAVHFLLSSNIGEIITVFAAMVFGFATPLLPIQLLWVNLITDSLPAIALGLEPPEKDVMEKSPPKTKESLFSGGLGARIFLEGAMIGMLSLIAFAIGHIYFDGGSGHITGRTMAFAVLSISQLFHSFNMRSESSVFSSKPNTYLLGAFLVGIILQTGVIMLPPVAKIFMVTQLSFSAWLIVAFLSSLPLILVTIEKVALNYVAKGVRRRRQLQA